MLKKTLIAAAAAGTIAIASPALAWGSWGGSSGSWGWSSSGGHTSHYCGCGDRTGSSMCNTTTSSSGNTTSTTTTSTTSGGNEVPEPGMLGIAGAGLVALGVIRRRKAKKAN